MRADLTVIDLPTRNLADRCFHPLGDLSASMGDSFALPPVALYLHLPFCPQRCCYCDIAIAVIPPTSRRRDPLVARYLRALRREQEAWEGRVQARTLYLGGGTPTFLRSEELTPLLVDVRRQFSLPPDAEVTLEANPGTLDPDGCRCLRGAGINRLSLGVQAFDDQLLRWMNRGHTAAEAVAAFRMARAAGFGNLSLDLILGLPGQTMAQWRKSLRQAVALGPEHLSLYALTVEPHTPLERWIATGRQTPPDEALAADMYEWALDYLAAAGYQAYEISNFARPGFQSQHNAVYWRNEPYLGFGTGAASYLGGVRWSNVAPWTEYLRRMESGGMPIAEQERLDLRGQMRETIMLGLRMAEGIADARFRARFGVGLADALGASLGSWLEWKLVEWVGDALRLTRRGVLLSNVVFRELL